MTSTAENRGAETTIGYRMVELVERIGHGAERRTVGEFGGEEEAIGQALALHTVRGGYLVVEQVETRTVREIGRPDTPRIVVDNSPYYATSPRGDGIYHLRSERGPLPEIVLFTFDRHARVVIQSIADTAKDAGSPF